ncbi:MAG: isoprenylcysteine carboxylmethyltransferase family protein [Hyphomonadaceae bacterium]|jgi:protein-S-isoprenylcysteine O-methyltransferase Ste14|nr:isoprenylcysteine carboxylmethyltransferase family protein [Hyphomonadaceae bacterium]
MRMSQGGPFPDKLQKIQRRRKLILRAVFGLALLPILVIGSFWWPTAKVISKTIEWTGIVLIFVCIFGRTWCTLYIGGRKKRQLVTLGPYSLCRNPLYTFTVLGVLGIGAQFGSMVVAGTMALATFAVFASVVRREEAFLAGTFGAEFARYAERVPAFLPRFSGWKDVEELSVSPHLIYRTFWDATLFLLAIPASELIETLQRQGTLPVLLRLP